MIPRVLLLVLLCGCAEQAAPERAAQQVPLEAAPADDDDQVVATVNGRAIRASEVALQARSSGQSAREALEVLLTAEVLADEAVARGLVQDPEVVAATRAAQVRSLVARSFERELTPATVPVRELRRAYAANLNRFDHSEYVDTWHILIPVSKTASPEDRARAQQVAAGLAKRAHGVREAEAFKALAVGLEVAGAPARVERVITARDGWVLPAYSYAAFDQLKKPGDSSEVVQTDYGYHVIHLNRRIPPEHTSFEEAVPRLQFGIFPEFQRREFLRWVDALVARHQVRVRPERL